MTRIWYWAEAGEQRGPVDVGELSALAREGRLVAETPVWCSGLPDWQPAGSQAWFVAANPVTVPPPLPAAPVAAAHGEAALLREAGPHAADPAVLLCPACRTGVASEAVRCPSCHISFLGGYGPSLRATWPRAKRVVLIVAAIAGVLNVLNGIGAVVGSFISAAVFGAFIVLLYAKVVADRPTTLGESVRSGGRWQESGRGHSAFFFWWSD